MTDKPLLAERIYAAIKNAAGGKPEISIRRGLAAASIATNMPSGLVNSWLNSMAVLGWIHMDGINIWLAKDYGAKPLGISPEEQEILDAYKVPAKAEQAFRRRLKLKTAKGDKKK